MIKAIVFKADGRSMLILGLSKRNIDLLQEGKPTSPIDLVALRRTIDGNPEVHDVVLMYGETEDDIMAEFRRLMPGPVAEAEEAGKIRDLRD